MTENEIQQAQKELLELFTQRIRIEDAILLMAILQNHKVRFASGLSLNDPENGSEIVGNLETARIVGPLAGKGDPEEMRRFYETKERHLDDRAHRRFYELVEEMRERGVTLKSW